MSQSRARKIKLILFDVDGVMTDGSIWLFPAPAGARQSTRELAGAHSDEGGYAISSDAMVEAKGFNALDGTAKKELIQRVLKLVDGNKSRAAQLLGLDRRTLYRKLERWDGADKPQNGEPRSRV